MILVNYGFKNLGPDLHFFAEIARVALSTDWEGPPGGCLYLVIFRFVSENGSGASAINRKC